MTTYEILSVIFSGVAAVGSFATAASVTAAFISFNKNQVKKNNLKYFWCPKMDLHHRPVDIAYRSTT